MKQSNSYFEVAELITKFLEGTLSAEESDRLEDWVAESEEHRRIWYRVIDSDFLEEQLQYWDVQETKEGWKKLRKVISGNQLTWLVAVRKTMRYAAIVGPVLLILGIGWYLIDRRDHKNHLAVQTTAMTGSQILPRGRVAKLIMGNGKVIHLKDSIKKPIIEIDGTKVKSNGGQLKYLSTNKNDNSVIYNTLETPRGGEYQIVLEDGTKVWLNAATSLRFPTQFSDKKRVVYLSGEAYFEIAKDEQHPFIVKTGKMNITVLGTKFNVSAYADDKKQTTTLATGAVRINYDGNAHAGSGKEVVLRPGYEAIITNDEQIKVNKANIKAALAWKNGLFIFDSETLGQIMRTLSRWYNVDINYDQGIDTTLHFTGRIRKYEDITGILKKLELTKKIRFTVQGHDIRVIPYSMGKEQRVQQYMR